MINTIVAAVSAFVIGAGGAALLFIAKKNRLEKELAVKDVEMEAVRQRADEKCNEMEQRLTELNQQKNTERKEALEQQQMRFDETIGKLSEQIKNVTAEMLKERQREFSETNSQSMNQIVNPLKETIEKMQKSMSESSQKQTDMGGQMKTLIDNMTQQAERAKQSADNLTRVFKHGSKVQGDWGEVILDEILTSQGLTQGVHYDIQDTMRDGNGNIIKNSDGSYMRPDVILHLDEHRDVIIDSKVSMTAFIDYVNAENDDDRQRYLNDHINSLKKHVKELSDKDYSSYVMPPKIRMDYVIMFVPNTSALYAATRKEPTLWRDAMQKNVFIADEQTLFAALRIISLTWREIAQARNHKQVYELANELLERVGMFTKKYDAIGKALESAQKAYDEGEKKLAPTGQSIIQTCTKLTKLGAKQSDKYPLPQIDDTSM